MVQHQLMIPLGVKLFFFLSQLLRRNKFTQKGSVTSTRVLGFFFFFLFIADDSKRRYIPLHARKIRPLRKPTKHSRALDQLCVFSMLPLEHHFKKRKLSDLSVSSLIECFNGNDFYRLSRLSFFLYHQINLHNRRHDQLFGSGSNSSAFSIVYERSPVYSKRASNCGLLQPAVYDEMLLGNKYALH